MSDPFISAGANGEKVNPEAFKAALELGTAADTDATDYATAAQGALADTALQPTVATKTTPVDADTTELQDSADAGARKLLTFANLWLWVKAKLDTALTIAGNKTLSGQLQLTGQSATDANSAMTRSLVDLDDIDFSKVSLRDDFIGGVDADTQIGQLHWERINLNGAGTFRPMNTNGNIFGVAGLHTAAAYRAAQVIQHDVSNVIGGGGMNLLTLANATTKVVFRFQISSLNTRFDAGFQAYNSTSIYTTRRFGINYTKAAAAWTASAAITLNEYRQPTVSNGRRYYASVGGTTGGTEPTWPTTAGGTVVDGTVTWTEAGRAGGTTFVLINHPTAGEVAGTIVDTGITVAINTWYVVEMVWVSGNQWRISINGVDTNFTTVGSLNTNYTPCFLLENSDNVANQLSIDYWGLISRITR